MRLRQSFLVLLDKFVELRQTNLISIDVFESRGDFVILDEQ